MKEIKRWHLSIPTSDNPRTLGEIKQDDKGEYILYLDRLNEVKQLQARIKERESQSHINEIKTQGIEEAIKQVTMDCMYDEDPVIVLTRFGNYAEQLRTKYEKNN